MGWLARLRSSIRSVACLGSLTAHRGTLGWWSGDSWTPGPLIIKRRCSDTLAYDSRSSLRDRLRVQAQGSRAWEAAPESPLGAWPDFFQALG